MNLQTITSANNITLIEVVANLAKSERIDRFLAHQLIELSRSRIQILIDDGYVTVNDVIYSNPK